MQENLELAQFTPPLRHLDPFRYVQQIIVAEIHMLRWICSHTRRDRVRNDDIRDRLGVAPIEKKLVQHRLRWFGHVQQRPPEAPVRSGILSQDSNMREAEKDRS